MTQTFKLARAGDGRSVTPGCGEDLGVALARFGDAEAARFRATPEARVMLWGNTVAQIFYLAAEAFEQGASASIGHNRSARYEERARELRGKADAVLAEATEQRDEVEGARMKAAFVDGYEGGDVSRYSFDTRAAFLVGRHFAGQSLPIPNDVRVERGDASASNYVDAGGGRYVVRYPGGKINAATVQLVDAA